MKRDHRTVFMQYIHAWLSINELIIKNVFALLVKTHSHTKSFPGKSYVSAKMIE